MLVYDGGLRPSGYPSDGRLQSRHTVQILSSGVFSANTMPPFLCLYFFSILPKINPTELLHKQKKLKSTLTRLQYAQKVLILQKLFHL